MKTAVVGLTSFCLGMLFWQWWTMPERIPSQIHTEVRPMEQKMFLVVGTDDTLTSPYKAVRTTTYHGYLGLIKFADPKKAEALQAKIKQALEESMKNHPKETVP